MEFNNFPSYTTIASTLPDSVDVLLESGKAFSYQTSQPGIPGRYRAMGARVELDAGALTFARIEPIQVSDTDKPGVDPNGDPVVNKEITYSIEVENLEEVD